MKKIKSLFWIAMACTAVAVFVGCDGTALTSDEKLVPATPLTETEKILVGKWTSKLEDEGIEFRSNRTYTRYEINQIDDNPPTRTEWKGTWSATETHITLDGSEMEYSIYDEDHSFTPGGLYIVCFPPTFTKQN